MPGGLSARETRKLSQTLILVGPSMIARVAIALLTEFGHIHNGRLVNYLSWMRFLLGAIAAIGVIDCCLFFWRTAITGYGRLASVLFLAIVGLFLLPSGKDQFNRAAVKDALTLTALALWFLCNWARSKESQARAKRAEAS